MFRVPLIKLRQADGSLLVKAGKPEIVESEVSVSVFHRETGVSKRHIATLCEQGFIKHRRLTPKKDSKIMILRSEIARYRALDGDTLMPAVMPAGEKSAVSTLKANLNASHPVAKRGGLILDGQLNH